MKSFYNKKIGIFGLGKTGISLFNALSKVTDKIICGDDEKKKLKEVAEFCGQKNIAQTNDPRWCSLDYIALSPGVPLSHKIITIAKKNNIRIISDIETLCLNYPESNYICITGTNGKSTTTALIGHIINNSNRLCKVGGNIGAPCLSLGHSDTYVLELSSYQIDLLKNFHIDIGVLLNITPDHLQRYDSIDQYIKSKEGIISFMDTKKSILIASVDNPYTKKILKQASVEKKIPISYKKNIDNGIFITKNKIFDNVNKKSYVFSTRLKGKHNLENIAASFAVALMFGISIDNIVSAIASFESLPHRMQYIGHYKNVSFYNDSKATNADAAAKALDGLNNIYWIAGGVPKTGGIESLKPLMRKVKKAYFFGKAKNLFVRTMKGVVDNAKYNTMKEALDIAFGDAIKSKGRVSILLCPSCASFDQFKNFEERGEYFIKLVKNLKNKAVINFV